MIRHVVMFKFADSFTPRLERDWVTGLGTLVGQVPGLHALSIGRDVLGSARSWDYVIVADFESLEHLAGYAGHPLHVPLIALSGPHSQHTASVDFDRPTPTEENR